VPIKDEPERREGKTLYFIFAERQGSWLREHPAKPNLPQRGGIIGGKVCIHYASYEGQETIPLQR
jgi:hypothetical protein